MDRANRILRMTLDDVKEIERQALWAQNSETAAEFVKGAIRALEADELVKWAIGLGDHLNHEIGWTLPEPTL
jgi:hypothetical protein